MIYLIVIGFGVFAFTQLKIDLYPDLALPIVVVITSYSGVGPEDIENLVTRPLEEAVSATENVDTVSSQSMEGTSLVLLRFAWGTNMDVAETDIRNRIDMVRDYLPDDANEPIIVAFDPSLMPIVYLSLSSPNLGPAELRQLAGSKIEPLLERVNGVASVQTVGGLERQINVSLDPILMASYEVSPDDVVDALRYHAGLFPAGKIETSTKKFNLRIFSEYRSVDDIRNTELKLKGGVPVRVQDVAEVEDGYEELLMDVRVNGGQGIAMFISKQSDANTVQTSNNVKKALPEIESLLPEGTRFSIIFDQAQFILLAVTNLRNTALIAFGITFLVIYVFLRNWRGSVIMGVSIPVSVIATFGVLMLADLTLNAISMAGLALAIGMLVDNSIVVLENIYRHREMGKPLAESADIGTTEVGMAIIASTLTTVSVFLPVLFVPGITGQLFRDMVITISFSLGVSLFVALTLVPMLSSKILHTHEEAGKEHHGLIKRGLDAVFEGLTRMYGAVLHWSVHHKILVLLAVAVLFGLSLTLVPSLGGEFMPQPDQGMLQITAKMAASTPLEPLRQVAMRLEQVINEEVPERDSLYISFGEQEGMGAIGTSSGTIEVILRLVPKEERERSQSQIEDILRRRFAELPGVTVTIAQADMMGGGSKAIDIQIIGHDLERAQYIAEQLKEKMGAVSGLVDVGLNVSESIPQLRVHLDQDVLNDFHLSGLQVASIVSTAIEGKTAVRYRDEGDEYAVLVRLAKQYRQNREILINQLQQWLPQVEITPDL